MNNINSQSNRSMIEEFNDSIKQINNKETKEEGILRFPYVEENKKLHRVVLQLKTDWKEASNPKEVAHFSNKIFQAIKDESLQTREKFIYLT